MNVAVRFAKLLGWMFLALATLALSLAAVVMNYQGLATAITLMNLETAPIGQDPLIGWVFDALTPDTGFAQWLALVIAALIYIACLFATHQIVKTFTLLNQLPQYRARGEETLAYHALRNEILWSAILVAISAALLWGDLFLFRVRAMASTLDLTDPTVIGIQTHWDFVAEDIRTSIGWTFLSGAGAWLYLGASIACPLIMEFVMIRVGDSLAVLVASLSNGDEGFVEESKLYGYDAEGNPVFDPETPIAYDVDQNPVSGPDAGAVAGNSAVTGGVVPETTCNAASTDVDSVTTQAVIGGTGGQRLTLSEALARPAEFIVDRATRRIYALTYWAALHGAAEARSDTHQEAA